MTLLILGLVLWWITHLFPMLAPAQRNALAGNMMGVYKAVFAILSVLAILLMIVGYRDAPYEGVYVPPVWGMHVNNLVMVFAVGLFGASHSKGNVKRYVRHPMLLSVFLWGVAHLMVNGDVASLILFGGMAVWSLAAIWATNRRDGAWAKPAPAPFKKDLILIGITIVAYVVIVMIHTWLGYRPVPG